MSGLTQTWTALIVASAAMAGASCRIAPSPAPVPVAGARGDLAGIAGEWTGRYWSETANRHGTIVFRLQPGADTAYGEVEMTFAPALRLYGESQADAEKRRICNVIDIAIVRVEGNKIRGALAPHWDPDCDCRVETIFEGELTADRITGTFTSRKESTDALFLSGQWVAERRRHSAAS